MAISAFHYPFYDQLGGSVHTRLRLFALPCALLLRRLRGEVYEQLQRERFGVPKKETVPEVRGIGS